MQIFSFLIAPFTAILPISKSQAFNSFFPNNHTAIDNQAFDFLRNTILTDITDEHVFQDTVNLNTDYIHFDNSQFTKAIEYINTQYTAPRNFFGAGGVIAEFAPTSPQPFDATDEFGQLLHTVQDFYSHSNWVDYDPASVPLFDDKLGKWTEHKPYVSVDRGGNIGKLLILEGGNAAGRRFAIRGTGGLMRLVEVTGDPEGVTKGLVTGGFPNDNSQNLAPVGARIGHGATLGAEDDLTTLHKDRAARTNFQAAFDAAINQTEHEWCRMLHLTKDKFGFAGSSIPMALWVDPSGSPHPTSTACSTTGTGTQSVQVTIKSIKVLNDTDPDKGDRGELNFPFVLYRKDFTKSVRTNPEVHSISVESGNHVPKAALPAPLTLDLNNLNDLVITLQAWDDEDPNPENPDPSLDGTFNMGDDVLKGITDFFPGPLQRKVNLITPGGAKSDLEVCLEITVLSNLAPQQVESEGCLDFGDAPDSYKTLLESDGPRYQEGDAQRLGLDWDDEWDGQPTPLANGDDRSLKCSCSRDLDDEDGVIFGHRWVDVFFRLDRSEQDQYNLSAWWDINKNDFFDHPSERKIFDNFTISDLLLVDEDANLYTKRYFLDFDPKDYFSRFRLTFDPTEEVLPWGEVLSSDGISHGEVEDYAPVPEPSSILGLFALSGLGLTQLRKKRQ
ncbi:MAG: PEP-CTERM sorting domain-containing protein [Crocosphaera sp.]|nr:PEP-CTERM sorting domain-containing protein [Crocosphaera sp.]